MLAAQRLVIVVARLTGSLQGGWQKIAPSCSQAKTSMKVSRLPATPTLYCYNIWSWRESTEKHFLVNMSRTIYMHGLPKMRRPGGWLHHEVGCHLE